MFHFVALAMIAAPCLAEEKTMNSLTDQLQEVADASSKRLPPPMLKSFKEGIQSVKQTGIEASAKQVGDQAVDAELVGWDGQSVTLSEAWKDGPVVLMWYRGGWCPYCNIQLRAMQQRLSEIEGAGATLIVLTPELPAKAKETAEANDLSMKVLHDAKSETADKYGILFDLPDSILPIYRDKLKLGSVNGNDKMQLPLAATYVIDSSGKITYAFLDADYKKRAEPDDVIAAVKAVQ
jgi:peroxiredoxin